MIRYLTLGIAAALVAVASPTDAATADAAGDAATADGAASADRAPFQLEVSAAGLVSLSLAALVSLRELFEALGDAASIAVEVRKDPGEVGPLTLQSVPLADALHRLAAGQSLILGYDLPRGGQPQVVSALLIGNVGNEQAARATPSPPPPTASPAEQRNQRGIALRDIVGLSNRKDPTAVMELSRILATSKEPKLRAAAVSALASIGGASALDLVDREGLSDSNASVRARAVASLWQGWGEQVRPRLVAALATEQDATVREAIRNQLAGKPPADKPARARGPHAARVPR